MPDEFLPDVPEKPTDQQVLRWMRICLVALVGVAALMLVGGGLAEWDQANQPREFAVVTALLPHIRGCDSRGVVTFDTSAGQTVQATICTRSVLLVGAAVEVRYHADHPDQAAPADEDQALLLFILPALLIVLALGLLVISWLRPDLLLRRRRYWG